MLSVDVLLNLVFMYLNLCSIPSVSISVSFTHTYTHALLTSTKFI